MYEDIFLVADANKSEPETVSRAYLQRPPLPTDVTVQRDGIDYLNETIVP